MNFHKRVLVFTVLLTEFVSGHPYPWPNYHSVDYHPYENWQDQSSPLSVNALDYNNIYLNSYTAPQQAMYIPENFHETQFKTNPVNQWPFYNDAIFSMTQERSPVLQNVENQFGTSNSNCFTWTSPEGIQFKLRPMSRSSHFSDGIGEDFYDSNCGNENSNYYSQPYYSPGSVSDFVNAIN